MHIFEKKKILYILVFVILVSLAIFAESYKFVFYGIIVLALAAWPVLEIRKNISEIEKQEPIDSTLTPVNDEAPLKGKIDEIWNKKLVIAFAIFICITFFIFILSMFFEDGPLLTIFFYSMTRAMPFFLLILLISVFYKVIKNFIYIRKNKIIFTDEQPKYRYSFITLILCIIFPIVYSYLFLKFSAGHDFWNAGPYLIVPLLAVSFIYILCASGLIFVVNKIDKKEISPSFTIPATILGIFVTLVFGFLLLLPFVL